MPAEPELPSVYTIIFWLIQEGKIKSEMLFSFLELYWPTFIERDSYVFLKEQFSETRYAELIKQKLNPEFWINFLTLDDFFAEVDDKEEQVKRFIHKLMEIWQAKLEKDFPDKEFIVKYLSDPEYGDYGLTFYQKSTPGRFSCNEN